MTEDAGKNPKNGVIGVLGALALAIVAGVAQRACTEEMDRRARADAAIEREFQRMDEEEAQGRGELELPQ